MCRYFIHPTLGNDCVTGAAVCLDIIKWKKKWYILKSKHTCSRKTYNTNNTQYRKVILKQYHLSWISWQLTNHWSLTGGFLNARTMNSISLKYISGVFSVILLFWFSQFHIALKQFLNMTFWNLSRLWIHLNPSIFPRSLPGVWVGGVEDDPR